MLDKLEFMIALSREQHFGRAAQACGVAQPTLSLGIQSLEEMFNAPLVKRASRFQGFTPEGERLLVWAHRLVGDARAMRQDILGEQSGQLCRWSPNSQFLCRHGIRVCASPCWAAPRRRF